MSFLTLAEPFLALNIPVFPIAPRGKLPLIPKVEGVPALSP